MDYTLAVYDRAPFDDLTHRLTLRRLIERYRYPEELENVSYDPTFAIRGLTVDRELGHIIKMDSHRHVGKGYHGFRALERDDLEVYRKRPPNLSDRRYELIDTLFELPEAFLFAVVVDLLESRGMKPDFGKIADDIRESIDSIHADDSLKSIVTADLPRYILRDRRLGATLHRLRSSGQKLFLMTNSYFPYTDAVMAHLLADGPRDYRDWRAYFDVIVTGSNKPSFFRDRAPFLELDEAGEVVGEESQALRRGVVYQHGNLRDFERMIGVRADEILYVGDHIYGDILRSKRDSAWRTLMIIPEMEDELRVLASCRDRIAEWAAAEEELQRIRDALVFETELRYRLHPDGTTETAFVDEDDRAEWERAVEEMGRNSDRLQRRRRDLVEIIRAIEQDVNARFHPWWGPLLKAGNEHSIFGEQVESYACLYSSRVTNLLAVSPVQYHRSPRDRMPHETLYI